MKILEPQRFILILKLQICAELSWNIILEISNIVEKTKCLILIKQTKDARITDKAQGIDVFYIWEYDKI